MSCKHWVMGSPCGNWPKLLKKFAVAKESLLKSANVGVAKSPGSDKHCAKTGAERQHSTN